MPSRSDPHTDLDDATVARYAAIASAGWAAFALLHALSGRYVTALTHLVPATVSFVVRPMVLRPGAHRPAAILMLAVASLGGLASSAIVSGDPRGPAVLLLALVPLLTGIIRIGWVRWTVLAVSLVTSAAVPLLSSTGHPIEPLVMGPLETTIMTIGLGLLVFRFGTEWRLRADAQLDRLAAQSKLVENQRARLEASASEIARARDEAIRASAAKSRFVAMTSHEIRGPLNGLVGLSHALSDTELSTHQRAIVQALRASSDSLTKVVGELLDVARIEAGKIEITPTRVDVRELIDDVVDTFAAMTLEKNVELLAIAHKSVPELAMLDGARLRQAVANLVGNATKFTDRGHVRVVAHADDDWLEIVVADTGRGISAQDRERLFAPFEQVSDRLLDRQAGTGLGLWLTRNFVQAMGGSLEVRSEVGLGTTFTVRIPCKAVSVPEIDRHSALPPARVLGIVTSPLVGQALVTSATRLGLTCDITMHDATPATGEHDCVIADVDDGDLEDAVLAMARAARASRGTYLAASPRRLARAESLARRHQLKGVLLKPFRSERVASLFADVSAPRPAVGPVLSGHLLVVDDEPINRVVARHLAEALGLEVAEAASGVAALAWIDANECDVVLMDLHLDEIDGAETAERIRARFPTRPIIVGYSGVVRDEDRARFHRAGVSEVLGKPLERTTFETVLRAAIGRIRRRQSRVGMRPPSLLPTPAAREEKAVVLAPSDGSKIDSDRLRELVKLVGESQARTLAAELRAGLDERIARILDSARGGQGKDVAAAAHNLASLAAMFGLGELADRCRRAELEAESASSEQLEVLGRQVAETVVGSRAALDRVLGDWPA